MVNGEGTMKLDRVRGKSLPVELTVTFCFVSVCFLLPVGTTTITLVKEGLHRSPYGSKSYEERLHQSIYLGVVVLSFICP
jgi:hypothetical protein